jgi:hypothetical protein
MRNCSRFLRKALHKSMLFDPPEKPSPDAAPELRAIIKPTVEALQERAKKSPKLSRLLLAQGLPEHMPWIMLGGGTRIALFREFELPFGRLASPPWSLSKPDEERIFSLELDLVAVAVGERISKFGKPPAKLMLFLSCREQPHESPRAECLILDIQPSGEIIGYRPCSRPVLGSSYLKYSLTPTTEYNGSPFGPPKSMGLTQLLGPAYTPQILAGYMEDLISDCCQP